jgi:hypothetical protein
MSNGENQEVDLKELERLTNEEDGYVAEQTADAEPNVNESQPQTNNAIETPESQTVIPEVPVVENKSAELKVDDVVSKVSKETPYKTVEDLINGYKSSQSEVTKFIEKVKPVEQLINDVTQDPQLRQFIDQAVQLYRNPQLAQQYMQPNVQNGGQPNPQQYDLYTPEGLAQFQQDTLSYAQKAAFETVNQRMSGWEQQQQIEKAKLEFSRENPDANVDEVMKFVQERNGKWSLGDAYKIANYDKVKTQAYEQAKKEILSKQQEAVKNSTQSSSPTDKPTITPTEMVSYVSKYGVESANKKWGVEKVRTAIKQFTEENEF